MATQGNILNQEGTPYKLIISKTMFIKNPTMRHQILE